MNTPHITSELISQTWIIARRIESLIENTNLEEKVIIAEDNLGGALILVYNKDGKKKKYIKKLKKLYFKKYKELLKM